MATENGNSQFSLSGDKFVDYVIEKAKDAAVKEVETQNEAGGKKAAIIWSALGFIGFSAIVGVANLYIGVTVESEVAKRIALQSDALGRKLENEISDAVTKSLRTEIEDLKSKVTIEQTFQDFLLAVERLVKETEAHRSFSDSTRDDVLKLVEKLASHREVFEREAFKQGIGKLVSPFVRARQSPQIDRLDDVIGDEMSRIRETALRLTDHYGERLMAIPLGSEEFSATRRRLDKYLRYAKDNKYPEKALAWQLMVEFRRADMQRTKELDELVEKSLDLDQEDRKSFRYEVKFYAKASAWQKRITQEGRTLERLVTNLMAVYPQIFNQDDGKEAETEDQTADKSSS